MSVQEGLRHLVVGPDEQGQWPQGTIHLPDWIGEDELRQLTAERLVDPRHEVNGKGKKLALVGPGDKREWRKAPHQPNEAFDIAVGCRSLAWGAGAGQLTMEQWLQRAAEAHRAPTATPLIAMAAPAAPAAPDEDFDKMFDRLAAANAEYGS